MTYRNEKFSVQKTELQIPDKKTEITARYYWISSRQKKYKRKSNNYFNTRE